MNYTIIEVVHDARGTQALAKRPVRPVPHLVLEGYSHFGSDSGILGWVKPAGDESLNAVVQALGVTDGASYSSVETNWSGRTASWEKEANAAHLSIGGPSSNVNSTVVFTMRDESGRSIEDCVIAILDQAGLGVPGNAVDPRGVDRLVSAANSVSKSIMPHSPIHNNVQRGSYSFYIDYYAYVSTSPHWFHAEASLPGQLINFFPLTFTQPPELQHTINPNEVTLRTSP